MEKMTEHQVKRNWKLLWIGELFILISFLILFLFGSA
jgi:hypothetical protein